MTATATKSTLSDTGDRSAPLDAALAIAAFIVLAAAALVASMRGSWHEADR